MSFSSKPTALAEETPSEEEASGMKSWEIVLIVLGVAIGVLCIFFVGKQMGSSYDRSDLNMGEAEGIPEEDCMNVPPEEDYMMMGPPEEDDMMMPPWEHP